MPRSVTLQLFDLFVWWSTFGVLCWGPAAFSRNPSSSSSSSVLWCSRYFSIANIFFHLFDACLRTRGTDTETNTDTNKRQQTSSAFEVEFNPRGIFLTHRHPGIQSTCRPMRKWQVASKIQAAATLEGGSSWRGCPEHLAVCSC